jgi:predicted dehydrogenase
LWLSQIAPGNENALRIRVYGETGGLEWAQEWPNRLLYTPFGQPRRVLTRAGDGTGPAAAHATRIPAGHPEGYLEGFAQLYRDAAELIRASQEDRSPDPNTALLPGVDDGVRGMRFIAAAVASSRANSAWIKLAD